MIDYCQVILSGSSSSGQNRHDSRQQPPASAGLKPRPRPPAASRLDQQFSKLIVKKRFRCPTHQHEDALRIVKQRMRLVLPQLIGQYKSSVKKGKCKKPHPPWTDQPNWDKMKKLMEEDERPQSSTVRRLSRRISPRGTVFAGRTLRSSLRTSRCKWLGCSSRWWIR